MLSSRISQKPVFSFIVPVYNTSALLPKCVESILAQTAFSIEIILVDDGSTDASYAVCREYSEKYPFVTALTKKNEGQGVARNVGVATARGEFVCFVDSDDWIDPLYCQTVHVAFADPVVEFVNFGCAFKSDSGQEVHRLGPQATTEMTGKSIFLNALVVNEILSSPCTKAFRRKFLIENGLSFPALRANEDIFFACLVARAARKTVLIPDILYNIFLRPGSTSRAMSLTNFLETEKMVALERTAFALELSDPVTAKHFDAHVVRIFTYLLFLGAARLRTTDELKQAFVCADRCGLAQLVDAKEVLALLPIKNRIMAMATRWRSALRPMARLLHLVGVLKY
ncbi:glycosyltransferase [Devosia sp. MC1541]|uniref:glycosyltransferase family 2 protein n=1 Tax=Devosia sp. MC1541 TaxID=2725264 RepID=UPI00145D7F40|nr:glycosyltransferase [Devosia sp. MC1541]